MRCLYEHAQIFVARPLYFNLSHWLYTPCLLASRTVSTLYAFLILVKCLRISDAMPQILTHQYLSDSKLMVWPQFIGKASVEKNFW